ncbi:hypothetical protein [Streptomyces goshikiensis]|uniref:hypothetical protein n=1 Tax=Streptomyces goshikiensis TaxID=1942 RepID=UPI0036BDBD6B
MTLYGIPPAAFRRAMAPDDSREHARRIADDALSWWWENRGTAGDLDIAVGTLAAVALAAPSRPDGPDYGPLLIPLGDDEAVDAQRAIWNSWWAHRPALAAVASPLHQWLESPGANDIRGLGDYVRILVRAGLLEYASDPVRCQDEDLFGLLVQRMRARSTREHHGQFFTPAGAADLTGDVLMSPPPRTGARLIEPCAGTGTMARAAAATLRAQGVDPAHYSWWLNDIDELYVACSAVNSALFRLGPHVTVSRGDAFGDVRAIEEQAQRHAEQAVCEQQQRPVLYRTHMRSPRWPA